MASRVPSTLKDQAGVLARWFEERGFGFITCEGKDYFVHRRDLPMSLQRGGTNVRVMFDVIDNTEEKTGKANNVREMGDLEGEIAMWSPKGYGFISSDGKDYFVHAANLPPGIEQLEKGMRFKFDLGIDRKRKKVQAMNLEPIEGGYERRSERERDYAEPPRRGRELFRAPRERMPEPRYESKGREYREYRPRREEPMAESRYESYGAPESRYRTPEARYREPEPYRRRPEPREEPMARYRESYRPEARAYREEPERRAYRPEPDYRQEARRAPPSTRSFEPPMRSAKKDYWQTEKPASSSYNRLEEKRAFYSQF